MPLTLSRHDPRRPAERPQPAGRAHEPPPPSTPAAHITALQRSVGNAQTARMLRQATAAPPGPAPTQAPAQAAPAQDKTPPQLVNLPIDPDSAIVFKTATATVGGVNAHVTGRMSLSGKASLVGEQLPAKNANSHLRTRVREQTAAALNAAKPAGGASKIELPIAGDTLVLELAAGAEASPAFQVSGRFDAAKRDFTVPGCEITGATITLDATVWIEPVTAPPANATPAAAGDASVKRFSFAGDDANLADPRPKTKDAERSGTVVSKAAMDAFEARVPAFVKNHSYLKLPEQRAAFFQQMRAYFGDDAKTVDHFAGLRKANVKGATTYLHDEAATRLEKVQAEIGAAKMPSSGGVGWPRSECKLSGKQDLANLHNLGFAVDYNAYEAPHIKDEGLRDLLQIVTGRSPSASYGKAPVDPREVGKTYTQGSDEEKGKLDADASVQSWLDGVEAETKSLGQASEDFRSSLKGKDAAGAEVDLKPKLLELRTKWFAAKTKDEKDKILAELPVVLKPWLDKVDAQRTAMEAKIRSVGLDPAQLPTGKELDTATAAAEGLETRIESERKKLGSPLKKGQRATVNQLIAEARKLTGDPGPAIDPAAEDAGAVSELTRLADMVDKRGTALKQKKWLDRVTSLHTRLTTDGSFVFGKTAAKQVSDPGAAQLADQGFYTLQGSSAAGAEAFGPEFVRSMVKHGFTHGGTWGTPDLMHFELRWAGPGSKP